MSVEDEVYQLRSEAESRMGDILRRIDELRRD